MILYLLAAQVAVPAPVAEPAACAEFKLAIEEVSQLTPNVVLVRPGKTIAISPDGRKLLQTRDELAGAMKAGNPDLARIERLMREELRLRQTVAGRHAAAKITCDIALLHQLDGAKLRKALDAIRPRTAAELEQARRNARIPPPPPIPPAVAKPRS